MKVVPKSVPVVKLVRPWPLYRPFSKKGQKLAFHESDWVILKDFIEKIVLKQTACWSQYSNQFLFLLYRWYLPTLPISYRATLLT